jgi:coenzyme F420 hydrogenase subunit beta
MTGNTVQEIADLRLCCSCGACAWACPRKAISYIETVGGYLLPSVNSCECLHCGVCRSICPGLGLVPTVGSRLPKDPFEGTALQTYVGKATNKDLYSNSQSGGIASALLTSALETGEIAGAITTVMAAGKPPRATARLAKSIDEIKMAQKSKYCPVPLLSILGEIENLKGRVAFVGVACQMHGLLNLLERFSKLQEKISFTLGLVCDRVMTYAAVDYLLKRAGASESEEMVLHFRDKACGGYPGNVNAVSLNGCSVSVPSRSRIEMKDFFTPVRCRLCFDKMNVFADAVVGDPHGITEVDRVAGESVAIIRTERGRELFNKAIQRGDLNVRDVTYHDVLEGQAIRHKRAEWRNYAAAWIEMGYPLPNFSERLRHRPDRSRPNGRYKRVFLHALSLDQYPSRRALVTDAERHLFFRRLRGIAVLPWHIAANLIRSLKCTVSSWWGLCS